MLTQGDEKWIFPVSVRAEHRRQKYHLPVGARTERTVYQTGTWTRWLWKWERKDYAENKVCCLATPTAAERFSGTPADRACWTGVDPSQAICWGASEPREAASTTVILGSKGKAQVSWWCPPTVHRWAAWFHCATRKAYEMCSIGGNDWITGKGYGGSHVTCGPKVSIWRWDTVHGRFLQIL